MRNSKLVTVAATTTAAFVALPSVASASMFVGTPPASSCDTPPTTATVVATSIYT